MLHVARTPIDGECGLCLFSKSAQALLDVCDALLDDPFRNEGAKNVNLYEDLFSLNERKCCDAL